MDQENHRVFCFIQIRVKQGGKQDLQLDVATDGFTQLQLFVLRIFGCMIVKLPRDKQIKASVGPNITSNWRPSYASSKS